MKLLFAVAFCFLCIDSIAQVLPLVDGKVVYEQIDSVKGTKEELFVRSKVWLVKAFVNAKAVIQLDDKEAGKLMGKGTSEYSFRYGMNSFLATGYLYYTVEIDCRENKARIRIYHIEQGNMAGDSFPIEDPKYYRKKEKPLIEAEVNKNMLALLASFKEGISKSPSDNF